MSHSTVTLAITVAPAKAGASILTGNAQFHETPAFAGVTGKGL
jgi:hypothetical protein